MCKNLLILVMGLAFSLNSVVFAGTGHIIWVSDGHTPAGDFAAGGNVPADLQEVEIPWDQPWEDLLVAQGYNVQREERTLEGTISPVAIDMLNAADLIIHSRDVDSGLYNNPDDWNAIETPLIIMNAWCARSNRLNWFNSTTMVGNGRIDPPLMDILLPEPRDNVKVMDGTVGSGDTSFVGVQDAGNGTVIAVADSSSPDAAGSVYIAEWAAGVEFYPGAGHIAGGPRVAMFFGTREGTAPDGLYYGYGMYNLTSEGEQIFLDTVASFMPGSARGPSPVDKAIDVVRDVVLSWIPGKYANTHDVYLGITFDDVNDADTGSALLVSAGQSATTYDPPGRLEFGQIYYWRVDEVNNLNPDSPWKGDVWSFTVEPFAYPIENIIATASSSAPDQGPENTVNDSGLNDSGLLHGTDSAGKMWLSSLTGIQPSWIAYEFDRLYKLHDMWIWNYNETWEPMLGVGIRDATIEYSVDGSNYTALGTTHEFAQGPGTAGYAHNTAVDFGGVTAKHVRLTANSNWGGGILNQYGLSEVRLSYIPLAAREPSPVSGATNVDVDVILGWRAGTEAASHDVYVGADPTALVLAGSVTEPSFDTASLALAMGQSYYWRVDEVNDAETPATWQGELWSFSTQEFLVVDDFESYNDIEVGQEGSNLIYMTWSDGFDNPSLNGSTIGYTIPFEPTMETQIVHGGNQSVPFMYDNSVASLSEVTVNTNDLAIGRDWTKGAAETMVLWFYGDPSNAATERMYVKVNGVKVVYPGDVADITRPIWTQWNIDLAALGISLSNVTQLSIGFERTGASGGEGTVLIDDILLYRTAPEGPTELV